MSDREIYGLEERILALMQLDDICDIIKIEDKWWESEDEHQAYLKFVAGVKRFLKRFSNFKLVKRA